MILTKTVAIRGKQVDVSELKPTTGAKVDVQCPECRSVRSVHYRSIAKAGHTICQKCMAQKRAKALDIGSRYNMLTVIGKGKRTGHSLCLCDCGTEKEIDNFAIQTRQKSCGCIKANNFDTANRPKGEAHGMWKGGTSTERGRESQTKKYKDWRMEVLSLGCCAKCKAKDGLQAHHVHDFDSRPDLRTDPNNGVPLCGDCHLEFHRRFGRKNTNQKQLEEFMEKTP